MCSSTEARSAGGNSRRVGSNQGGVHNRLVPIVARHAASPFRRPIADEQRACFARLDHAVREHGGPLILDSGCGTGASTSILAERFADHLVIGIDKSTSRLQRTGSGNNLANRIVARGDCVDLWRLAAQARWPVVRHYLLYPNPWPKAKHVQRRWHAHPVFPKLLALGGVVELRSNWAIYAREFSLALASSGYEPGDIEAITACEPLTPFEAKYHASGHRLYRITCDLARSSEL